MATPPTRYGYRPVKPSPEKLKRHAALEELSRDYHHARVVAHRLKRADRAGAADACDSFLAYWKSDGREHFREEEEILLPACAGFLDPDQPLVARVLTEHVRIRHLAREIASSEHPPLELLHELGSQLERHVRREERELFPLIEQTMPGAELDRLVALLSRPQAP